MLSKIVSLRFLITYLVFSKMSEQQLSFLKDARHEWHRFSLHIMYKMKHLQNLFWRIQSSIIHQNTLFIHEKDTSNTLFQYNCEKGASFCFAYIHENEQNFRYMKNLLQTFYDMIFLNDSSYLDNFEPKTDSRYLHFVQIMYQSVKLGTQF